MEEVALESCALPGTGWVVLGVSTMRAPLVGPRWVSCDLRVLGRIRAGVGALAAASHLWQIPRVHTVVSGGKELQPSYPGSKSPHLTTRV